MMELYGYKILKIFDGRKIVEGHLGGFDGPLWRTSVLVKLDKSYAWTSSGKCYHLVNDDVDTDSVVSHMVSVNQFPSSSRAPSITSTAITDRHRDSAPLTPRQLNQMYMAENDTRTPMLTPIVAADENYQSDERFTSQRKRPSSQSFTPQRNASQSGYTTKQTTNTNEKQVFSGFKRPLPPSDAGKLRLTVGGSVKASRNLQKEYERKISAYIQKSEELDAAQSEVQALEKLIKESDTVTYDRGNSDLNNSSLEPIRTGVGSRENSHQPIRSTYKRYDAHTGLVQRRQLQPINRDEKEPIEEDQEEDLSEHAEPVRHQMRKQMRPIVEEENTGQPIIEEEPISDSDDHDDGNLPEDMMPLTVDDWLHRHNRKPAYPSLQDRHLEQIGECDSESEEIEMYDQDDSIVPPSWAGKQRSIVRLESESEDGKFPDHPADLGNHHEYQRPPSKTPTKSQTNRARGVQNIQQGTTVQQPGKQPSAKGKVDIRSPNPTRLTRETKAPKVHQQKADHNSSRVRQQTSGPPQKNKTLAKPTGDSTVDDDVASLLMFDPSYEPVKRSQTSTASVQSSSNLAVDPLFSMPYHRKTNSPLKPVKGKSAKKGPAQRADVSPGGKRVKYTDTTYIVPASKIKKTATYQKTELTVAENRKLGSVAADESKRKPHKTSKKSKPKVIQEQDSDSEEEEEEEDWSGSELERYTNALIDIPAGRFFCDSDFWIAVAKYVGTKNWNQCQLRFNGRSKKKQQSERNQRANRRSVIGSSTVTSSNASSAQLPSSSEPNASQKKSQSRAKQQTEQNHRRTKSNKAKSLKVDPRGSPYVALKLYEQRKAAEAEEIFDNEAHVTSTQPSRSHRRSNSPRYESYTPDAVPRRRGRGERPHSPNTEMRSRDRDERPHSPNTETRSRDRDERPHSPNAETRSRDRDERPHSPNTEMRSRNRDERTHSPNTETRRGRVRDERPHSPNTERYRQRKRAAEVYQYHTEDDEDIPPKIKLAGKKTLKRKAQLSELVNKINDGYSPGVFDTATPISQGKRYRVPVIECTPLITTEEIGRADSDRKRLLKSRKSIGEDEDNTVRRRGAKETQRFLKSLNMNSGWAVQRPVTVGRADSSKRSMSDRHMATDHGMGDGMRPRAKPHDNVRRVAEQLQRYPDESEDNQDQDIDERVSYYYSEADDE